MAWDCIVCEDGFISFYFIHMNVLPICMQGPQKTEQGVWSSGTGVPVGCPLCVCWELTPSTHNHGAFSPTPKIWWLLTTSPFCSSKHVSSFPIQHSKTQLFCCTKTGTCGKYSRITENYFSSKCSHTPFPVAKAQTLEQLKLVLKARQGSFGYGTWGTCLTFLCFPSTGAVESRSAPVSPVQGLGNRKSSYLYPCAGLG